MDRDERARRAAGPCPPAPTGGAGRGRGDPPGPRDPARALSPAPALLVGRGLGRRYRGAEALRDVDVELHGGEAVALLGPNGAGKTTLLTILAGVARPGAGTLEWADDVAPRVGWVPQRPSLYSRLTARENLRLFAALEGAVDAEATARELIARADLGAEADRQAARLSTGTLQRLNLAIALAGGPSALLLDEPTATLSPDQRHRLWTWLHELRERDGLALLFSTQSVDEAMRHGDRLLVLAGGRLVLSSTAEELARVHGLGAGGDGEAAERAFIRLVGGQDGGT